MHIKNYLTHKCAEYIINGQFLYDMGIIVDDILLDEMLKLVIGLPELIKLSSEHENFGSSYLQEFRIRSVAEISLGPNILLH